MEHVGLADPQAVDLRAKTTSQVAEGLQTSYCLETAGKISLSKTACSLSSGKLTPNFCTNIYNYRNAGAAVAEWRG